VLYVGKATNLRTRTASHFSSRTSKLIQPEMLTQVSDITVTVVASALEAALLEHEAVADVAVFGVPSDEWGEARVWYATRDFVESSAEASAIHAVGPLPSEYSLRPLGAQVSLLEGAEPTWFLRANAVGVSDLWTPPEAVFARGFALFEARHFTHANPSISTRSRVLRAAKQILASRPFAKSSDDSENESEAKNDAWDPERVARHLERAAAQAYQVYRRARWLRLLHDSDVVYREPEGARARLIRVREGVIVTLCDAGEVSSGGELPRFPSSSRAVPFDRAKYDRLRILGTELKRIQRDGGSITIFVRRDRAISAHLLGGILRNV